MCFSSPSISAMFSNVSETNSSISSLVMGCTMARMLSGAALLVEQTDRALRLPHRCSRLLRLTGDDAARVSSGAPCSRDSAASICFSFSLNILFSLISAIASRVEGEVVVVVVVHDDNDEDDKRDDDKRDDDKRDDDKRAVAEEVDACML